MGWVSWKQTQTHFHVEDLLRCILRRCMHEEGRTWQREKLTHNEVEGTKTSVSPSTTLELGWPFRGRTF